MTLIKSFQVSRMNVFTWIATGGPARPVDTFNSPDLVSYIHLPDCYTFANVMTLIKSFQVSSMNVFTWIARGGPARAVDSYITP